LTLVIVSVKNRAAYEKAREYFSSLLDRETEATTVQVFQIDFMAIRADEAGQFPRVMANSSLLPREPEPPENVKMKRRRILRVGECITICSSDRPAHSDVAKYGIPCSPFAVTCDDHI
jgi:hypothetical protein